jgi:hypothetical protein
MSNPIAFGVMRKACLLTGLDAAGIRQKNRKPEFAWVRQAIIFTLRERTGMTMRAVAEFVGLADHKSVADACAKAAARKDHDADFAALVTALLTAPKAKSETPDLESKAGPRRETVRLFQRKTPDRRYDDVFEIAGKAYALDDDGMTREENRDLDRQARGCVRLATAIRNLRTGMAAA